VNYVLVCKLLSVHFHLMITEHTNNLSNAMLKKLDLMIKIHHINT